ncbi:hypothetical protein D3C87_1112540 [compost metagenome]
MPEPIESAPALSIVASPLIETAVATPEPLPTQMLALVNPGKLALGVVQVKTPEPFVVNISPLLPSVVGNVREYEVTVAGVCKVM